MLKLCPLALAAILGLIIGKYARTLTVEDILEEKARKAANASGRSESQRIGRSRTACPSRAISR